MYFNAFICVKAGNRKHASAGGVYALTKNIHWFCYVRLLKTVHFSEFLFPFFKKNICINSKFSLEIFLNESLLSSV